MKPKQVLNLYKKAGETPLERLLRFKAKNPKYKDIKITYAGRLDPMAEGVLLVVCGQEIKNKEKYLKLKKEYEAEFLFGIETDTHDLLGKVEKINFLNTKNFKLNAEKVLLGFQKEYVQSYPKYSSKTVDGIQLHALARAGEIRNKDLPKKSVNIYLIKICGWKKMSGKKLLNLIKKNIIKVGGDFRQQEILSLWKKNLKNFKNNIFSICNVKIKCSSGTYVRQLAHDVGQILNVGAIACKIKRTKVGNYSISRSIK
ncbi:MAG: hypothetical protein IT215_09300 [Chitinophagaceae bacterium]|nr:hypothetical protein [Chitinophagaceae bacterium]